MNMTEAGFTKLYLGKIYVGMILFTKKELNDMHPDMKLSHITTKLIARGMSIAAISRKLKICRSKIYRALASDFRDTKYRV